MSSNNWMLEMEKMLSAFDDQAMMTLLNIQKKFEQSKHSFNEEFRANFLKLSNDR